MKLRNEGEFNDRWKCLIIVFPFTLRYFFNLKKFVIDCKELSNFYFEINNGCYVLFKSTLILNCLNKAIAMKILLYVHSQKIP